MTFAFLLFIKVLLRIKNQIKQPPNFWEPKPIIKVEIGKFFCFNFHIFLTKKPSQRKVVC